MLFERYTDIKKHKNYVKTYHGSESKQKIKLLL